MEETTTTEPVEAQVADSREVHSSESQAAESATQATAEGSTESTPTTSNEGAEATTTDQTASSTDPTDEEVKEWAQKKGLDLTDPVKLAKSYRESERAMHAAKAETKAATELSSQMDSNIDGQGEPDGSNTDSELTTRIAKLETNTKVANFYAANPEAREFDADMARIVKETPEAGALPLPKLLQLAKSDRYDEAISAAEERGRTKANESFAKATQASTSSASASNPAPSGSDLSEAKIANMTLEEYQARRPEILDWQRKQTLG